MSCSVAISSSAYRRGRHKKPAHDYIVKDGFENNPAVPPCFAGNFPHAYQNTNIFLATDVCLHVAKYSAKAFDRALRGPFNNLRSAGFTATPAL